MLSKTFRVFLVVGLVSVFMVMAIPANAAHQAGVVIFRGQATSEDLCYPVISAVDCNERAGQNPNNYTGVVALGGGRSAPYSIDTGNTAISNPVGPAELNFCVGVAGTTASAETIWVEQLDGADLDGADAAIDCRVTGSGLVEPTAGLDTGDPATTTHVPLLGAWCGLSHGHGTTTVTVAGHTATDAVQWATSAATVLPIEDGDLVPEATGGNGVGDRILGMGVVDAIGTFGGGSCDGIIGDEVPVPVGGPAPSEGFNVIGVSVGTPYPV